MGFEECLIRQIRAVPYLYDSTHSQYKNKLAKDSAWERIAEETGSSVKVCRARWKSLRDCFVRELHKQESGSHGAETSSGWRYFNHLYFMKESVRYKERTLNRLGKDPLQISNDTTFYPDYDGTTIEFIEPTLTEFPSQIRKLETESIEQLDQRDQSQSYSILDVKRKRVSLSTNINTNSGPSENNISEFLSDLREIIDAKNNHVENENIIFMKSIALKMDELPGPVQRNLQMDFLALVNTKLDEHDDT